MRKLLLFALLICGCVASETQEHAQQAVQSYVRSMLGNPKYLETVSFTNVEKLRYVTSLDTSLNMTHIAHDDTESIQKYVDSENYQRPDLAVQNEKDVYNIKHGKLFYYVINYSFHIDSFGHKRLKRYHFELDTAYNVLKATDITYGRDTRQPN